MTAPDVIIVGAGSAGCVLANRLSADPARRVLLLEAGGNGNTLTHRIPAAFPRLFRKDTDWALETEPEEGLCGRRMYWPRGRMLGGSSAMNAMLWMRGHPEDYDAWAAAGCDGWGWRDVLPALQRAEGHRAATGGHVGRDGPMTIDRQRSPSPLTRAWLEAAMERGFPLRDDLNLGSGEGVGLLHVSQRRGERESAATAYLRPASSRPNLSVRTGVRVLRVAFDGPRAAGVEVRLASGATEWIAAGQVILSAGAVHSPHLLLHSGIGPGPQLRAAGLPVRMDLPGVGQNLQDHLVAGIGIRSRLPVSLVAAERPWRLLQWLVTRNGPLTSPVAEGAGYLRSHPSVSRPDLELLFAPSFFADHGFANPPGHGYTLGVVLLRPESRGSITLHGDDPLAAPVIRAGYLDHPDDLPRLVAGLDTCRQIASASAFDRWRGEEVLPGPAAATAKQLAAHICATAQTLYHPVGTCAMGTSHESVVSADLRVHGVERLRVIDASVMPTIISGHTNAPTIMIAERGAEFVMRGE